ncbi:MAG: lamin tail domain-containing protein, partial [Myxococcota bacterium]
PAPPAGTYDHAYRFSLDGGFSWLYCDGQPEGSSNGYQIENAGNLVTFGELEPEVLLITELADPNNGGGGSGSPNLRYVELYNPTDSSIDLTNGWTLRRWTNANMDFTSDVSLTGTVPGRGFFIVCSNQEDFQSAYTGATCDLEIGTGGPADSNGDDHIAIAKDGMVFDIFGVPGVDGSNTPHEFEDGRAERGCSNTDPATTWDASGWNVDNDSGGGDGPQDAPAGFDPGDWICLD